MLRLTEPVGAGHERAAAEVEEALLLLDLKVQVTRMNWEEKGPFS
jgi:hypothetical protein